MGMLRCTKLGVALSLKNQATSVQINHHMLSLTKDTVSPLRLSGNLFLFVSTWHERTATDIDILSLGRSMPTKISQLVPDIL